VRKKLLPLLVLSALACSTLLPTRPPSTDTPVPSTVTPPPTLTSAPLLPSETSTPAPEPTLTLTPTACHLRLEDLTLHPGPQLYSGDIVSLGIKASTTDPKWAEAEVKVYVGSQATAPIAAGSFQPFGIGGQAQATFWWAWDTQGLKGEQTLIIVVEPKEGGDPSEVLEAPVRLLPVEARPMPEPLARWAKAESACCVFHYLTGTAAERDLKMITADADKAFERVESALGVQSKAKVPFTLLSRLLGHGGFAAGEISLTYIDRNPAGVNLPTVFAHEGTHILDRHLPGPRPTIMTEGLAVFVAGGHYKPEDLDRRAAALLALGRYVPLKDLANEFYPAQHEIGYLQGGALIKYLVDTYGWAQFKEFYSSFPAAPSEAQMLDGALRAHYDKSLSEVEADWLQHLRTFPRDQGQMDDLRLTIQLFDTLRRYQQLNDPVAYYLTAWLPDGAEARKRGIIADFVRAPRAPENIALEALLASAERALITGQFDRAETLLRSVNAVLNARNLFFDPLAAQYLRVVNDLAAQGYEAQTIDVDGDHATVTAIHTWPTLETFTLNSR